MFGRNQYTLAQPRFPSNGRRGFYENPFEAGKQNQRRRVQQFKNNQFQKEYMRRMGQPWRPGLGGHPGLGMGPRSPPFRHGFSSHRPPPMFGPRRRPAFPTMMPRRYGFSGLGMFGPRRSSIFPTWSSIIPSSSSRWRPSFPSRGYAHTRRGWYDDDYEDDPFEDDSDWGDIDLDNDGDFEEGDYYSESFSSRYPFSGAGSSGSGYLGDYDDPDDVDASSYMRAGGGSTRPFSSFGGSGYGYSEYSSV